MRGNDELEAKALANEIKRDLIVTAPRRVQFRAGRADSFRQDGFDIHVQIFELRLPDEFVAVDFLFYRAQAVFYFGQFVRRNNSRGGQNGRVRERTGNVSYR